jgi:hypothetical protein
MPALRRDGFRHGRWGARPASLAAACLLVLGGLLGYERLQSPATVSAASVLRRAAAATRGVTSSAVVHEMTVSHVNGVTPPPGVTHFNDVTVEQWTQVDAAGNPVRFDLRRTSPTPGLRGSRTVGDAAGNLWEYDENSPEIVGKMAWTPGKPYFQPPPPSDTDAILFLLKQTMNTPQDPAAMRALLLAAARETDGETRLLPQQTIDGRPVDVVEVERSTPVPPPHTARDATKTVIIISLDASTYLVKRIDMRSLNDAGVTVTDDQLTVTTYARVSPASVPPGTFTFTPGPGMQVCTTGLVVGSDGHVTCSPAGGIGG